MKISDKTQAAANEYVKHCKRDFDHTHKGRFAFLTAEVQQAMLLQRCMSVTMIAGLQTEATAADAAEWMLAVIGAVSAVFAK